MRILVPVEARLTGREPLNILPSWSAGAAMGVGRDVLRLQLPPVARYRVVAAESAASAVVIAACWSQVRGT